MRELLSLPGSLPLDARRLRQIAYEISLGNTETRKLTDQIVLKALVSKQENPPVVEQSLASMALWVARSVKSEVDVVSDFVTNQQGDLELSESFWRRIVSKLTGQPWVFILNYAENEASSIHQDVHGVSYGFHDGVTTWRGIVAAGPGSLVVFYSTSNAPANPMCFTGTARIQSIEEHPRSVDGRRTWRAHLEEFQEISPVAANKVRIPNRNVQHGIQAISWTTFQEIVELGGSEVLAENPILIEGENHQEQSLMDIDYSGIESRGPDLVLPISDYSDLEISPLVEYQPEAEREIEVELKTKRARSRELDRLTETRAVKIASSYLSSKGWALKRDRQRDGVGYDMEFQKDGQVLFLEVKGIRGPKLEFNMTAKEWHQCLKIPFFLLIAVTNVLDDEKSKIHLLWPSDLCTLRRQVTQFRLKKLD